MFAWMEILTINRQIVIQAFFALIFEDHDVSFKNNNKNIKKIDLCFRFSNTTNSHFCVWQRKTKASKNNYIDIQSFSSEHSIAVQSRHL